MKNWISRTWFLLLLLVALAVGSLASSELKFLADHVWIRRTILFSVMYVMALPVEPRAFGAVWVRPAAPLAAIAVNVFLVPLLGIVAAAAMIALQLDGQGRLPGGLMIACVIPCTLASAAVWTRRAGGNDLVALATTLVTNGLCFAIVPAWLSILPRALLGGREGTVDISIAETAVELAIFVVLPMALAQATRFLPGARSLVSKQKATLSLLAQGGILSMVLIGMVQSGQPVAGRESAGGTILEIGFLILACAAVHLGALAAGWYGSRAAGLSRADGIAVGIAGSQKTMMVGLELATSFGFSIVPMIAYHAGQLVLDTFFADRMLATAPKTDREAEPERDEVPAPDA